MSVSLYGITSMRISTVVFIASRPPQHARPLLSSLVAQQVLTRNYSSTPDSSRHKTGNPNFQKNYHPLMMHVSVEGELEKLNAKFDKIDAKLEENKKEFNAKFDKIDAKLEENKKEFNAKFEENKKEFNAKFDKIDAKFENLSKLTLGMPFLIVAALASFITFMDSQRRSKKDV